MKNDFNLIKHYLTIDRETFNKEVKEKAFNVFKKENNSKVYTTGLLSISNKCVNNCHYCGLNRNNGEINRFTLDDDSVIQSFKTVKDLSLNSVMLIGGENPKVTIDHYIKYIKEAKSLGLRVNLAVGEFNKSEYKRLKDAGLDMFTIKFEVSSPTVFNECNPDTNFEERMTLIRNVKEVGLELGTGSIVGLKNQSLDDTVRDIQLTAELQPSWVPIVPYIPAKNSIMAKDTPFGNVDILLRSISILRLLLPKAQITAGQPTQDSKYGFADKQGNIDALMHGANKFFVDVTPFALKKDFEIIDERKLFQLNKIDEIVKTVNLNRV